MNGKTTYNIEDLESLSNSFIHQEEQELLYKNLIDLLIDKCGCDCGLLFLVNDDYMTLGYAKIKSRNIERIGVGAEVLMPATYLPKALGKKQKTPSERSALYNEIVNLESAYLYNDVNTENLAAFDAAMEYNSSSLLSVPICGRNKKVLAVIELINAQDRKGRNIEFSLDDISAINAFSASLGLLLEGNEKTKNFSQLLESFIEVLAKAIDYKSPYTGVHCQRVPIITRMITTAVIQDDGPAFKEFNLSETDWYALHIASWLHDCGKITTPEYILDKATKLETIYNRIHEVRNRFEILRRDAHIEYLKKRLIEADTKENLEKSFENEVKQLEEDFDHVAKCNIGDTPLLKEDVEKLKEISKKSFTRYFSRIKGLSWAELNNIENKDLFDKPAQEYLIQNRMDQRYSQFNIGELYNLSVVSGTINAEERKKINDHIIMTIEMLKSIPFPKELDKIIEYAGGHHERIDGKGYPNGLTGDEMSIPTKIMAIADIFEALTSVDRPYKVPKKLSQVLSIMQDMKNTGHIDPDIYEVFIKSKVYREYAKQYLQKEQLDEFNDEIYL